MSLLPRRHPSVAYFQNQHLLPQTLSSLVILSWYLPLIPVHSAPASVATIHLAEASLQLLSPRSKGAEYCLHYYVITEGAIYQPPWLTAAGLVPPCALGQTDAADRRSHVCCVSQVP